MAKNTIITISIPSTLSKAKLEQFLTLMGATQVAETRNGAESVSDGEKKSSKRQSSSKAKKTDDWSKYEPLKDEDGYYIYRSYKNKRDKYLKDNGYSYEDKGWMSREDYEKAVKPFTDHFKYIKKADR